MWFWKTCSLDPQHEILFQSVQLFSNYEMKLHENTLFFFFMTFNLSTKDYIGKSFWKLVSKNFALK